MSFCVSRSFDLGDLGVLEKSWGNIFNDYIFEISRFHWPKCTVECATYLILILKSAQARCEYKWYNDINLTFLVNKICHFRSCSRQTLELNASWKRENVSIYNWEKKNLTLNLKMSWVKGFKCSLCKFHLPKKGKNWFAFCLHLIFSMKISFMQFLQTNMCGYLNGPIFP